MKPTFAILIVCLLGTIMISPESFWVDECTTARYSQITSLARFCEALWQERGSEAQMPLYMLSVWVWGRFVPAQEWALRVSNIAWLGLLLAGCHYIARSPRFRLLPVLIVVQPFLWKYVNEFRPYAMQMSFAVWQIAALLDIYEDRNRTGRAAIWVFASWCVCASHMLGVVQTTLTALVIVAIHVYRRQLPSRGEWYLLSAGIAAFALLGGYFLRTLMAGAGGARLWTLSPANLGFALYELVGMNGLGPSPLLLRNAALAGGKEVLAILRPFLVQIFLFCMVLGVLVLLGARYLIQHREMRNRVVLLGAILGCGLVGIYILAAFVRWPFWGRHLASFFPTYILLLNCLSAPLWLLYRGRFLVVAALLLSAYSSLNLRFSPRLAKEDYRQAASYARNMTGSGASVWWIAYKAAGEFYGIDFSTRQDIRTIQDLHGEDLAIAPPARVILNRPDAFDPEGKVRRFLNTHKYIKEPDTITGFTVWKKP